MRHVTDCLVRLSSWSGALCTRPRRPQDGSFRIKVKRDSVQTPVDFCVSIVPSYYGESVVIRILGLTTPQRDPCVGHAGDRDNPD